MATVAHATREVRLTPAQLPVKVTGMQAMAGKMWIPFIAMGFMIVVGSFIIGLLVSTTAGDYFGASKAVREAAERGSDLATQKAFVESTKAWLPAFKFLGIGMLLGGVTFLLATILGALRVGGGRVQEALGVEIKLIRPPVTAKLFPVLMMMGTMILGVAVVIGDDHLRLLEPLHRQRTEPFDWCIAGRSGNDQRDQAVVGAHEVRRHGSVADRHWTGAGDDRRGPALAGQPTLGDPALSHAGCSEVRPSSCGEGWPRAV